MTKQDHSINREGSLCALRAAGEAGEASRREHGPQLESDAEFEAFLDVCEADAARHQPGD